MKNTPLSELLNAFSARNPGVDISAAVAEHAALCAVARHAGQNLHGAIASKDWLTINAAVGRLEELLAELAETRKAAR